MINELYIKEGYIYFQTHKETADEALTELFEACDKVGIELYVEAMVLRDENGNDIDG